MPNVLILIYRILWGISESQAVPNCPLALSDLYNSVLHADDSVMLADSKSAWIAWGSMNRTSNDKWKMAKAPFIRCRILAESLQHDEKPLGPDALGGAGPELQSTLNKMFENLFR